eukprot:CAMPEP_0171181976 /NCGR_PEP_ID=MMETSP0790-20130122/14531_1 /TAXON_ID=2925 /ORGANISM="Alexandrium catenella, Strain OF101" /LENGTH=148 /DNA_ID=CAMNT_0011646919 /DNA_START=35 /DNA_END=477 /DNA_ORIENTATION=+
MILAAARRFAAAPLRAAAAASARPAAQQFLALQQRSFAAKVSSPRPLSIRMDSLFVKCFIAAVIYFGPQDAVFLSGLVYFWHSKASAISPKKPQKDAGAALEAFKAAEGPGGREGLQGQEHLAGEPLRAGAAAARALTDHHARRACAS